ncbi:MAG: hypothetical protein WBB73_02240 [Candidatus Aminicenantaceae bacterium]
MLYLKRLVLVLLLIPLGAVWESADENSLLQVRASVLPRRLARGEEGRIELRFTLREGITISPVPHFTIVLDPSDELAFPKDFFTNSDLEMEIIEEEGRQYLNVTETVNIPFTVKTDARRGSHRIQGRIRYFGCFLDEGWCLKDTTTFSASFYTSNRLIQK